MATSDGTREQLFLIHVWVDGVDLGVWDKWDGGDLTTENTQYRSGGQKIQENLGGGQAIGAVTISRNYRISRDGSLMGFMYDHCSVGEVTASKQPLDKKYNAVGNPIIAKGTFTEFHDNKVDSNSNNAAMIEIVFEPDSIVQT